MSKYTNKESNKNIHIINHPLLTHLLSTLRKKETNSSEFRRVLSEMSRLMAYECSRDLTLKTFPIETPLEKTDSSFICEDVTIVSVMRAGMGMLDGFMQMFPLSKVGHIGIYRDKFLNNTVEYYFRLPDDIEGNKVFLLDPLLATGATVVAAIERLKQYGVKEVRFNCLLASPEGIEILQNVHPDVQIYCLSIERTMNEKGYLLPGLGDAGDRIYGTI
ncbi:uracil phosphoribosyltransferase [Fluviispira multicolorata]|uniref:Uracil phosphoribosyltransferase n=1 Tax=Fluviispira multicolorata TaxID=2654512 RepID=A0A833JC31_9BACT|nr:uracil phosphoribosyltransferase [Fluviispira multicolorata]KAB8029933.1 uracil phosphoribosyltransferase [Fluviispira multicolorata]